ncbi:MAG: peptidase U32 family protein, partial [Selenomonas sp.]
MIELLAPAGSREALTAAVESGADAVYLAGNMFGARAYADNFDEEGLREAITFAHSRDVRVHVTVNTIVRDEEMAALSRYLRFLYEAGADAALVQDLGVYRLARQAAPDLPLHASTQMTVHNLEGVLLLQEMGFERVVLSRELSLEDIRYITAHCQVEIETFVHGALCVCYSGQCLMSSMIGGRSGNRGRCAQPCRLPYTLVDETGADVLGKDAGQFLLSPKDLKTIELLPELLESGIASLKIEGRMKRPEYVAVVVDAYRRAIDAVEAGRGLPSAAEDEKALAQIFNRDFTTAYLKGRPGRTMMSESRPNNRGLLVGRVLENDRTAGRVKLKLSGDLAEGDQLDFWVKV